MSRRLKVVDTDFEVNIHEDIDSFSTTEGYLYVYADTTQLAAVYAQGRWVSATWIKEDD